MPIAYTDGRVQLGTCDRLIVGVWRAPFSSPRLRALRELALGLHARHGAEIGLLGVFESDAIELSALSNDALRREAAQLQADLVGKVRGGQGIVLEGNGFTVAALRSAALALQSISRTPDRPVFHPDVSTSLTWLGDRLKLSPAVRLEVERLIAEMRGTNA